MWFKIIQIKNVAPSLGIDADIQPQDLAATLERDLRSGELSVLRGGTCSGYYWEVEWIGIGGNKPEFIVDGAKLTGDGVTIGVTTITDGGLMLAPIPAEYLRLPEKNPQVLFFIYCTMKISGFPLYCETTLRRATGQIVFNIHEFYNCYCSASKYS